MIYVCRDGVDVGEFSKADFESRISDGSILPTDYYFTEGMVDWRAVSDYSSAAAVKSISSSAAQQRASDDREFYNNKDGVIVTASRFSVGATMYPIRTISSVATIEVPPDRAAARVLGGITLFFILVAIGAESAAMWFIVVALVVLIFVIVVLQKPWFAVQILTGGGEKRAYVHRDKRVVKEITTALHNAVANYGRRGDP